MITHVNPAALPVSRAFSQAVAVDGAARTIYIGGQNAVGLPDTEVDTLTTQTATALDNLNLVLEQAGAEMRHVVSWTVYVVGDEDLRPALEIFRNVWGEDEPAPAITVVRVAGLANPAYMIEISAVAVVPA